MLMFPSLQSVEDAYTISAEFPGYPVSHIGIVFSTDHLWPLELFSASHLSRQQISIWY